MFFFFFNNTATTEIYSLPLHDALPILDLHPLRHPIHRDEEPLVLPPLPQRPAQGDVALRAASGGNRRDAEQDDSLHAGGDRKSTRLNSSHANISYAVFCLKKKKTCTLY